MPKVTVITVSADGRAALERAAKHGKTHSFRQRCQAVLLKTERRTSLEVAGRLGCCGMAVNNWSKRYRAQGLAGLQARAGRGRKPTLSAESDLAAVRRAVQDSRQRVGLAKAELERELGKEFSPLTLRRFLKKRLPLQTH